LYDYEQLLFIFVHLHSGTSCNKLVSSIFCPWHRVGV